MIKHMDNTETDAVTQQVEAVEEEVQKPDFTSRYEDASKRFHDLREKGQTQGIEEYGTLNTFIIMAGAPNYKDLVDNEDPDNDKLSEERNKFSELFKNSNPEVVEMLEKGLEDLENKLDEREGQLRQERPTEPAETASTIPIEHPQPTAEDTEPVGDGIPGDTEPSFVKSVVNDINSAEDRDAARIMDQFVAEEAEGEVLRVEEPHAGVPIRAPKPILGDTQPIVPLPQYIAPPVVVMPPAFIAPPLEPPPMESLLPPTDTVLRNEKEIKTEKQELLIKDITREAQKIMEAFKNPKNFDKDKMNEYSESLSKMQALRQELYLNIQNNLPRGSYVLGWRMTQFMRSNKLLQSEAEKFMNEVNNQGKPNIDRFKKAEKLYREWEHKLQKWYEDHGKNWNLDHLVRKKVEKYKNNPQKLYKELKKASDKLDRRSTKMPEGDFWDVLENFNLLYMAFRETMSSTVEAHKVVSMFARQLNGANTLRKIAETGKGNEGDVEEALRNYKNGVQERNKIKKVKIKPNGRKYTIDLKLKGGD